eukprot:GSChrysophyteH1.ASY1.ANO1.2530.1 assembled CDS
MYVGQVEPSTSEMWVYDSKSMLMKKEQVSYSPALLKIFDEILVNASDNFQRGEKMSLIDVNITRKGRSGIRINVKNDGSVIPIEKHEKEDIHGYGAKLTNIFSKSFQVEIYHKKSKSKYSQIWRDNMFTCEVPSIVRGKVQASSNNITSITFEPDLSKFGLNGRSGGVEDALNGTIKMMERRVVDIAACSGNQRDSLTVTLNGTIVPVSGFESYVNLFARPISNSNSESDPINDRCEVACMLAPSGTFEQQSFVNSVWTPRGGSHVSSIASQVTHAIEEAVSKAGKTATNHLIRNRMMIFVKAAVENPQFDTGIVEEVVADMDARERSRLVRATSNRGAAKRIDVPKLEDAHLAGTERAGECILGRDKFGVLPLRGKILNVRGASPKTMANNKEITNLVKALGLQFGKVADLELGVHDQGMRYGKVLIMTDQDPDGSHIKGLLINFFQHFWPSFSKELHSFYSVPEYEAWIRNHNQINKKYQVKYYKGLGTSTASEAKERKDWLANRFDPDAFSDPSKRRLSIHEFINTDLMQFSHADNVRSLPSVIDGLKPAQRKVLFAYHHGDASLHATIINMAQDFVGSNNLPLLTAGGQFGTRAKGGSDYASPRYIFTGLSPLARLLYPEEDDSELVYNWEDGQQIEPINFVPILPTLLINGSYGIGTGWSTLIPPHHPMVVADYTSKLIRGESTADQNALHPWIRGFMGQIDRVPDARGLTYRTRGKYTRVSKTVLEIDELPYGTWTEDYKQYLLKMNEDQDFKRFTEDHTHRAVKFTIVGADGKDELYAKLRLDGPLSMRNMHAFDKNGRIKQYHCAQEIAAEHYDVRLDLYSQRKNALERNILNGELNLLPSGGARTTDLIDELRDFGFLSATQLRDLARENPEISKNSLTEERVIALNKAAQESKEKLQKLRRSTSADLWMRDIDKFTVAASKHKDLLLI